MQMTGQQIYNAFIQGAYKVIQNKEILNRINVFPIQDGDTGNNLSSMMLAIIQTSTSHHTVKKTLESISDAAFIGARGNSGIIFASYLKGLSETIDVTEEISIHDYANASKYAAQYAYEAVEHPVEGTMLTLMRDWGEILSKESSTSNSILDILTQAYHTLEHALEKTKEQLSTLRKANVVDSGAKGFTYFIEGVLYYLTNEDNLSLETLLASEIDDFTPESLSKTHIEVGVYRYCTECILQADSFPIKQMKETLKQMGNSIVVVKNHNKCRIHIHTNKPAQVFEALFAYGHMLYQKVDDMHNQEAIINHRKYDIALVTDSIADLPQSWIDEDQIQVIHLDILYQDVNYFDKLTIYPSRLLDMVSKQDTMPTFSQPSPARISQLLDYLSTYYKSIIIVCVSKELSGTYNSFLNAVKNYKKKNYQISVINSRQNSGAQGLLVKECLDYIKAGLTHEQIVSKLTQRIDSSKILVQVKNLDAMIQSGRLDMRAGALAKKIGMKPIITLDQTGNGKLENVAFSMAGSNRKIIQHIKHIQKKFGIEKYNIVHVNNEQDAKELAAQITQLIKIQPEYIMETSSIIALSAGDGAVAISYLCKKGV